MADVGCEYKPVRPYDPEPSWMALPGPLEYWLYAELLCCEYKSLMPYEPELEAVDPC